MPVPSTINDLSTVVGSNSPAGTDTPTEGDNYIRSLSAFVAQLRDAILSGTANSITLNLTVNGNTVLGDAAGDSVTINAGTLSLVNTPTISGAATWSGIQTFSADPAGRITSGKFTPTLTNTSNVASSSVPGVSRWIRVGPMVLQTGIFTMTPTSIGSTTVLGISLGVATNLGTSFDLNGGVSTIAQGGGTAPDTTHIFGDATNDRATVSWSGLTTSGLQTYRYWLMYEVI